MALTPLPRRKMQVDSAALRIARASMPGAWVWVEYRQPLGLIDSQLPTTGSNIFQGALLHYEDPYDSASKDFLVDMTATASPNNFQTSALLPGVTWSDPYSLLNIKTVSANTSGVTVTASYDTPCESLTPSYTATTALAATATTGSVTVTAPASCSWQASTAAPWISFTSATSGSGNGSVTFNVAANTGSERESFVTIQRQSVPVIQQQSTGVSVVSVSPVPGSGLSQTFTVNLLGTRRDYDERPYPGGDRIRAVFGNRSGRTDILQCRYLWNAFDDLAVGQQNIPVQRIWVPWFVCSRFQQCMFRQRSKCQRGLQRRWDWTDAYYSGDF